MTIALLALFGSSFLVALSGALMPGPLLTVTISESPGRGAIAGPLVICGHGLLELTLVAALFSGFAAFLQRDEVVVGISLLGGAILFWLALSMLRNLSTMRLSSGQESVGQRNLVVAGMALSLANPYWLLWWASIGLGYITQSAQLGVIGVVVFLLGHLLADLAWYSLVSFGVARGRHLLSDVTYRRLIGGCALFLLFFSCSFFYGGLSRLG
jgi:threonine/homoserine/homoserine lactone efflux protein